MKRVLARILILTMIIGWIGVVPILAEEQTTTAQSGIASLQVESAGGLGLTPTVAFTDVSPNAYYAEAVAWAVAKQVTRGTSATTFSPNEACTRGQVVTFLWRAMGRPAHASAKNPFSDVRGNAFYADAVMWAAERGITNGTSATTFGPEEPCTRAQVVTFLWRTMGKPEPVSDRNPFRDVAQNAYYYKAVMWAVEQGVTNGTSAAAFSPDQVCTRGQIVTFLFRALGEERYAVKLPILMYHDLTEGPSNTVSAAQFAQQMDALQAAGYTPVRIQAVEQFVRNGTDLPGKPVLITFDDGYLSNYEIAWPILRGHGFPAVFFTIGISIGKDTYKDTGVTMYSHFSMEQASEMAKGGLITVASHGYNIHEVKGRDPEPVRSGILPRAGESEAEYEAFLREDCAQMREILGAGAAYFAYPYGIYSAKSEEILLQEGVRVTMTTVSKTNVLVRGMPRSLLQLGRYTVSNTMSGADLVALLNQNAG